MQVSLTQGGFAYDPLCFVTVHMMPLPPPAVVVPVGPGARPVVLIYNLSRVHLYLEFLVDLPHVLSTGSEEVVDVDASWHGAKDSHPVPGVVFHDVLLNPKVFSTIGGEMDVALVRVASVFTVPVVTSVQILVATFLVLLPSSLALCRRLLDLESWGPVGDASVSSTAVLGDGTLVVAVKGSGSCCSGCIIRTDHGSGSYASDEDDKNVNKHISNNY